MSRPTESIVEQERDEPQRHPAQRIGHRSGGRMFERADLLGHTEPEHYLWPACQWGRYDATNPMLKWDTAWRVDLPADVVSTRHRSRA